MVEALRTDFSVRQICDTLGFTRSTLYYHSKSDPCEEGLRIDGVRPWGNRLENLDVSRCD